MFYTYVLISLSNGQLYIGSCANLDDRLKRHNQNRSKATKGRGPWRLYWARTFNTRSEAVQLERKLKRFKNHQYLLQWIEQNRKKEDLMG